MRAQKPPPAFGPVLFTCQRVLHSTVDVGQAKEDEMAITVSVAKLQQQLDHLDLSALGSTLDLSQSQIIWSPNGTGKSSIFKALKSLDNPSLAFAELDDSRVEFKKAGNTLSIGLGIHRIDELQVEQDEALKSAKVKQSLKQFGISKISVAAKLLPDFPRCTADQNQTLCDYNMTAAKSLIGKIDQRDFGFYLKHRAELSKAADISQQIEGLRDAFLHDALAQLHSCICPDETICPVCGAGSTVPILQKINARIKELEGTKDTLVGTYHEERSDLSLDDARASIERLIELESGKDKPSDEEMLSYCLCGGNISEAEAISKLRTRYISAGREIDKLRKESQAFFDRLVERETALRELFSIRFNASSVVLNNDSKQLEITLPRMVDTYSTGEINLMMTLVKINEFVASDNPVLIFDDPLSSLDKANQYIVMFELTRTARQAGGQDKKSIIILTHNMDCITIAQAQHGGTFVYRCMERLGQKIIYNELDKKLLDTKASPDRGALCAKGVVDYLENQQDQHPGPAEDMLPYIRLIMNRDQAGSPEMHEIFHYRGEPKNTDDGLTNMHLIEAIDTFDQSVISQNSFELRSLQKIYYMAALRVWFEKQLYDNCPSIFNEKPEENQIGQLIERAFPVKKKKSPWKGPSTVTRGYLNSRKTMLNQNAHASAQAAAFDYAINLSINDLCTEINDFKRRFGK